MRYESPEPATEAEISGRVSAAASDEDVLDAVLSALFHCSTRFAGDILYLACQKISGPNRLFLGTMTCTFLQMHATDYRVDDLIAEMRKDSPDQPEMAESIETALELKEMFRGTSRSIIQ